MIRLSVNEVNGDGFKVFDVERDRSTIMACRAGTPDGYDGPGAKRRRAVWLERRVEAEPC
jgi:hypothetical protein